jgi:hypothetical protein
MGKGLVLWRRRSVRWGAVAFVLVVLVVIMTRAAIAAVQDPYLVQYEEHVNGAYRYALVVVPRDPTSAEIERVIKDFAKKHPERPLLAEFYTDGNAAVSFEGGGVADTSQTAPMHVGEFSRGSSGPGKGWADAKGSRDSHRITFTAP